MAKPPYNRERTPFFDDAIAAFGYESARQLGETIIGGFSESQARLPLRRPVTGIRVAITEYTDGINGFANPDGTVDLQFSPKSAPDFETLCIELEKSIEHEVAHIAHKQRNPRFLRNGCKHFLFTAAIEEGIAVYAEASMWDEPPIYEASDLVLMVPEDSAERIKDTISVLLYDTPKYQMARYYDFLFGNMGLPASGYEVGEYIVMAMVNDHGFKLSQLMDFGPQDYRAFAESEL